MTDIRESVLHYVAASKRLLESDGLSEQEREIILRYLEAIEKLIQTDTELDT